MSRKIKEMLKSIAIVALIVNGVFLAYKSEVDTADLSGYIEVSHADPYVPSLPMIDVKKEELSKNVDKHIFVFERSSQFEILEKVPTTFMWVSPLPEDVLNKHNLIIKKSNSNTKIYKDVLIYRNDYKLTDLDNKFISHVTEAKSNYL